VIQKSKIFWNTALLWEGWIKWEIDKGGLRRFQSAFARYKNILKEL
jgi:hypothetical protein